MAMFEYGRDKDIFEERVQIIHFPNSFMDTYE